MMQMSEALPVVSMAPITRGEADADARVGRDLKRVLAEWGAFELVDHGVPADVITGSICRGGTLLRAPA